MAQPMTSPKTAPYFIWARARCGTCGWEMTVLDEKVNGQGLTVIARCSNAACPFAGKRLRISGIELKTAEVIDGE